MKTYVIGDLQGCHDQLQALLARVARASAGPQRILFAGDLVNRGPGSLATLRQVYAMSVGSNADTVLGNHDLHLLAVASGIRPLGKSDTLDAILAAPDRDILLEWLRRRPLAIEADGHLLVHAGVPPQWSVRQTLELAGEVEAALRGPNWVEFLREMYGNTPNAWDDALRGPARLRCVVNALTRMRFCTAQGAMDFNLKESGRVDPETGLMPWFEVPGRKTEKDTVVFGHWSALGLLMRPRLIGLDTGCVWGGQLTAVCLEDRALLQVDCPGYRTPGGKKARGG
jgi:bis(5'-nucleosyl)-tetraphosphatase (symmetrical)